VRIIGVLADGLHQARQLLGRDPAVAIVRSIMIDFPSRIDRRLVDEAPASGQGRHLGDEFQHTVGFIGVFPANLAMQGNHIRRA
jgi:hypothetical protein